MSRHFSGTYTAIVTPFKSGQVDYPALEALVERQIAGGVEGLVPAGSTGEAATLSHDEHIAVVKFVVERVKGRVQVIAGTGSNNTREAVELSQRASQLSIDGILVITPYYNKPTPSGMLVHFRAVADASRVPVILYNVPGRTGINLKPETVSELARHPKIVAIKEASGSLEQVSDILSSCKIDVLSGDDSLTIPMMSIGGTGVISVTANVAPREVSAMVKCALAGDFASAAKAHLELIPLHRAMFVETNPIPVKTMLAELGLIGKELRLPLEYGQPATVEQMRKMSARYRLK